MGKHKYRVGIVGHGFVGEALHYGLEIKFPGMNISFYDPAKEGSVPMDILVPDSDFIFVCVPTPTDFTTGRQDLSIVESVIHEIYVWKPLMDDKYVVIKTTVLPGTTDKLQEKYPSLLISHNPEFLTEANFRDDFLNQDRIVIGGQGAKQLANLYELGWPDTPIHIMSAVEAEMVKYTANCFLATKVAYFNQIYDLAQKLGADYNRVVEAVLGDKRIGQSHYAVPGPDGQRGFGGKCFPKDLLAYIWLFNRLNLNHEILWAANEINDQVREVKDWFDIKGATTENKH